MFNYREALDDPQIQHRGQVRTLDHPASGEIRVVGPPWKLGGEDMPAASPPRLGEHNEEIRGEFAV